MCCSLPAHFFYGPAKDATFANPPPPAAAGTSLYLGGSRQALFQACGGTALLVAERRRSIIWLMYSGDWVCLATKAYTTGTT